MNLSPLPSRRRVLLRTALATASLAALAVVVGRVGLAALTTAGGLGARPEAGLVVLAAIGADIALLASTVVVARTGIRVARDLGGTVGPPPPRGRLDRVVAGVLLGAGALAPPLANAAPARSTTVASMPAADAGPVDPTYLGPLAPAPTAPPAATPPLQATPHDAPETTPDAPTAVTTVVVRPGDTLWAIAERTAPRPRPAVAPDDAVVARTVLALFAANRAVIGDDPDLITPGTRLVLPDADRKATR